MTNTAQTITAGPVKRRNKRNPKVNTEIAEVADAVASLGTMIAEVADKHEGRDITAPQLESVDVSNNATPMNPVEPQEPAAGNVIASQNVKPARETKRARLIAMLKQSQGSTITELAAELAWLPHTTRAALTGLRQAGYQIERATSPERGTVYSISGKA